MKRLIRWVLATGIVGSVLFAAAGTWRDPWLWAYVAAFSIPTLTALTRISDDLAQERFRPPTSGADRRWLLAIRLVGLGHAVVGDMDVGRFHWTSVPPSLRIVGLVGFAASFGLIVKAMTSNRFFSPVVRVQTERGHHLVDGGPYAVIRHPGYAGMILGIPLSGLGLGSWLAVAIGLVYSALIIRRVWFEDRFLHDNLAGYPEYASRVRYRLVPGAW
jgi:protein-S-isoprenylcysteine O-methyltransferase Ste14